MAIESIDRGQRRISLAPGDAADEEEWKTFSGEQKGTVSSLGEKLQQAMKKKK